jgi:hypothetical protein
MEDCAGSLLAKRSFACPQRRLGKSDASAREAAGAERCEAKPMHLLSSLFLVCSTEKLKLCQALCTRSLPCGYCGIGPFRAGESPVCRSKKSSRGPLDSIWAYGCVVKSGQFSSGRQADAGPHLIGASFEMRGLRQSWCLGGLVEVAWAPRTAPATDQKLFARPANEPEPTRLLDGATDRVLALVRTIRKSQQ